jgi:hypothetical protein
VASRLASIITSLATAKGVAIIMHWAERDWNQSADALSKPTKDLRFCFSPRAFAMLLTIWKKNYAFVPNIDLFATRANALCNRFVTKTADPHATALDAFTLARAGEGWAAWMMPVPTDRLFAKTMGIPDLLEKPQGVALHFPGTDEEFLHTWGLFYNPNSLRCSSAKTFDFPAVLIDMNLSIGTVGERTRWWKAWVKFCT